MHDEILAAEGPMQALSLFQIYGKAKRAPQWMIERLGPYLLGDPQSS